MSRPHHQPPTLHITVDFTVTVILLQLRLNPLVRDKSPPKSNAFFIQPFISSLYISHILSLYFRLYPHFFYFFFTFYFSESSKLFKSSLTCIELWSYHLFSTQIIKVWLLIFFSRQEIYNTTISCSVIYF